jgi:hypothetical protein
LQEGSVEERSGGGNREQRRRHERARRNPEDGDIIGVAAESGDVLGNPFQRGDDIQQPDIAGLVGGAPDVAEMQEAEHAHAKADTHDDAVALLRQPCGMLNAVGCAATLKAAAEEMDEHRTAYVVEGGSPDVEIETVL